MIAYPCRCPVVVVGCLPHIQDIAHGDNECKHNRQNEITNAETYSVYNVLQCLQRRSSALRAGRFWHVDLTVLDASIRRGP